ncbi:MAG: hypothetical protein K5892_01580 [Acholeplasmatales bacterium]|nr:hypothetical protein [Acholeplasmatales bacterium]
MKEKKINFFAYVSHILIIIYCIFYAALAWNLWPLFTARFSLYAIIMMAVCGKYKRSHPNDPKKVNLIYAISFLVSFFTIVLPVGLSILGYAKSVEYEVVGVILLFIASIYNLFALIYRIKTIKNEDFGVMSLDLLSFLVYLFSFICFITKLLPGADSNMAYIYMLVTYILFFIIILLYVYMPILLIAKSFHAEHVGPVRAVIIFFKIMKDKNIFFILGIVGTSLIASIYLTQYSTNKLFFGLGVFYLSMATLKLINFIYEKNNKKFDKQKRIRRGYKIFVIDSIFVIIFALLLSSLLQLMIESKKAGTLFNVFVAAQLIFFIVRIVMNILNYIKSKTAKYPYYLIMSDFGLVTTVTLIFSFSITTLILLNIDNKIVYSILTFGTGMALMIVGLIMLIRSIKGLVHRGVYENIFTFDEIEEINENSNESEILVEDQV